MIVRSGGGYQVRSESGRKRLGSYRTKTAAVKRLRQIEWFKAHPKK